LSHARRTAFLNVPGAIARTEIERQGNTALSAYESYESCPSSPRPSSLPSRALIQSPAEGAVMAEDNPRSCWTHKETSDFQGRSSCESLLAHTSGSQDLLLRLRITGDASPPQSAIATGSDHDGFLLALVILPIPRGWGEIKKKGDALSIDDRVIGGKVPSTLLPIRSLQNGPCLEVVPGSLEQQWHTRFCGSDLDVQM
jgi:hypothetical protein